MLEDRVSADLLFPVAGVDPDVGVEDFGDAVDGVGSGQSLTDSDGDHLVGDVGDLLVGEGVSAEVLERAV